MTPPKEGEPSCLLRALLLTMSMLLEQRARDHQKLLGQAALLLGEPVRPVTMDWATWEIARRKWKLIDRMAVGEGMLIVRLCQGQERLALELGMNHYQLSSEPFGTEAIDVVEVSSSPNCDRGGPSHDFWAVRCSQFDLLQKVLDRQSRRNTQQVSPILAPHLERQLLENTIGFLQLGVKTLAKYGVAQKRGVLLYGEPGNGKTMACRWLRWHCRKAKLAWRAVTSEEYDHARGNGTTGELFQLYRPGIVQFDDFDHYFRDREQHGTGPAQTSLLAELDGLHVRRGVVYLFTTNAKLSEMDPAFRRPGRIDRFMEFPRPDAALRRRLLEETWHEDLRTSWDLTQMVQQTAGLSYAELDEVKKLLVLGFLDNGKWNWPHAWQTFRSGREDNRGKSPIGFAQPQANLNQAACSGVGISAGAVDWQI